MTPTFRPEDLARMEAATKAVKARLEARRAAYRATLSPRRAATVARKQQVAVEGRDEV